MDEEWQPGEIVQIDQGSAWFKTDDGKYHFFTGWDCARDGTSPSYLRVGDKGRRRVKDGCISAPNSERWSTYGQEKRTETGESPQS